MADAVISLGASGLVLADIDPQVYVGGAYSVSETAAVTLTAISGGMYRIGGLSEASFQPRTVTYQAPGQPGASYEWLQAGGVPESVILPLRSAGVVIGDLAASLLISGAASGYALTLTNVGTFNDYRLAGWTTSTLARDWVLGYSFDGDTYERRWQESGGLAYAGSSEYLESFGKDPDEIAAALESGAQDIDTSFQAAGYLAPINLTSMVEGAEKARLAAKLAEVNEALAAWLLTRGNRRAAPTPVATAYQAARAWLKMVAEKKVNFSTVPVSPRTGRTFATSGSEPHPLPNSVFEGLCQ